MRMLNFVEMGFKWGCLSWLQFACPSNDMLMVVVVPACSLEHGQCCKAGAVQGNRRRLIHS